MFVTTAGRTNEKMIEEAKNVALELKIPYIPRNKRSIEDLQRVVGSGCIVVGKDRLELFGQENLSPFFFHPNSSMFRIKRLQNGGSDTLVEAAKLERGMSFLDCTLGLASDAIVASHVVGSSGLAVGIEAQKYLAYLVTIGLSKWDSGNEEMNISMRQIKVFHENSLEYLKKVPSESFDCVYLDPMFEKKITESDGIKALDSFALHDDVTEELMEEARRVSIRRVVMKDHYLSHRFERFGFEVNIRKTAKFHFGVIEKKA
ncbi:MULTISPECIES: class I SAM-dependent methyltransferase [unclassified Bacillus (in: firmicutes)]|uniref:class I SAM-dependent methyltransferase n=1 Tax=unclassified Bacillus (in: firmicutes) TaxID=185979 RepID=UPI0008F0046E|nr:MULTISPECIES: class I SAM-dependent methyltransferase [unclassified Bacillus (in: firmicutes)]SFB25800.1 Putative SAM-dependent methyltransferase [Bacillus sp. UNCCL13]SFQ91840.1 Putative SAM-dependent methyltransferase [Bacillus sp. cl95]